MTFVGAVPQAEVQRYLWAADVFLSVNELSNVGNPLLEAMLAGRCILTLDEGDTRDLIKDGETGVLLPTGEPVAIADALAALARGPGQAPSAWPRRALAFAQAHFWSWEQRIDAEVDAVEALVAARTPVASDAGARDRPSAERRRRRRRLPLQRQPRLRQHGRRATASPSCTSSLLARALGPEGRGVTALYQSAVDLGFAFLEPRHRRGAALLRRPRASITPRQALGGGLSITLLATALTALGVARSPAAFGDQLAREQVPYWLALLAVPAVDPVPRSSRACCGPRAASAR